MNLPEPLPIDFAEPLLAYLTHKFRVAVPDDVKATVKATSDADLRLDWLLIAGKPNVTTLGEFRNEAGI